MFSSSLTSTTLHSGLINVVTSSSLERNFRVKTVYLVGIKYGLELSQVTARSTGSLTSFMVLYYEFINSKYIVHFYRFQQSYKSQ